MAEIRLEGVRVDAAGRRILGPLDLHLAEHRIGVIGANGSGKSTLIRLLNGLTTPAAGRVTVDGRDVARRTREVRREVGFIFSDAENQIIMPTVAEDVAFSLRRMRLPRAEREARVAAALRRFGLTDAAGQSPHTLSGGNKQLLALAAVLVMEPRIIVADEPTTLLDLHNRLRIREEFARLPQQLVVATHDLELLEEYRRVLWLGGGRVVADGPPGKVLPAYRAAMAEAHGGGS